MSICRLQLAIEHYLQRCPQNCTLLEKRTLDKFLNLSQNAQRIFENLYTRKGSIFRKEKIPYFAPNDEWLKELIDQNFCWDSPLWVRPEERWSLYRLEELQELCKENNIRKQGRKDSLIERLQNVMTPNLPFIYLRHQSLFQRICITFLHNHSGDLDALILHQLDHVNISYMEYELSKSQPLHRTRLEFFQYFTLRNANPEDNIPIDCATLLPIEQKDFRFSPHRFFIQYYYERAQLFAQSSNQQDSRIAENCFAKMIALQKRFSNIQNPLWAQMLQKYTLFLLKMNEGAKALDILKSEIPLIESTSWQRQLVISGRHIASRCKSPFWPLPILKSPKIRQVHFEKSEYSKGRRLYNSQTVEIAIIELLKRNHREAFYTENTPWKMLFSLLMLPVMFEPIDHQLPAPLMSAPLDFGTREFYKQRKESIDLILRKIQSGQVLNLLQSLRDFEGKIIRGVNWSAYSLDELIAFAQKIPNHILLAIITIFLEYPIEAQRGMPDLLIFEGEESTIDSLFPKNISQNCLFVEVKSPTDVTSHQNGHMIL